MTIGRVTGRSALFQAMNLAGSAGFIINGWWHGALPSAALNVLWLLIALFALWRIGRAPGAGSARRRG